MFVFFLPACQEYVEYEKPASRSFSAYKKPDKIQVKKSSDAKGFVTTHSGLQYKVIRNGLGKKPAITDRVKVHYDGRLLNGKQFDSSYKRGKPATFPLANVIQGWSEGLQLMNVGSKYQFIIPHELAYGGRSIASIPAYSTLFFEVELLGIE